MQEVVNYQIFQRCNGVATVPFGGPLPEDFKEENRIYARVLRENDNLVIAPWVICQVADGRWHTDFVLPEGGLYRLEACFGEHERLVSHQLYWRKRIKHVTHVGVGELYLITGQSNMAGYGRDMAFDPPQLGVHLYGNNGKWDIATHPLNDSVDTIYPANGEYCSGTSPALSFARTMCRELGVPVGLVQASLGGSSLSAWHPEEDGKLYRGMMERIPVTGPVGGILWYQGCSDIFPEHPELYLSRFTRMIELWREKLGNIPVITVQLNRKQAIEENPLERAWGQIKEAQRKAADTVPLCCVVPSHDMVTTDMIHNSAGACVIIGERMAYAALKTFYNKIGNTAPSVRQAKQVDSTHFQLYFDRDLAVYTAENRSPGFWLEDAEGMVECTKAVPNANGLLVEAPRNYTTPAKFHAYWNFMPPAFFARSAEGMPMLACYDVTIEE